MNAYRFSFYLCAWSITILLISTLAAYLLQDSFLINRGGALIAASAALSGYIQIRLDIRAAQIQHDKATHSETKEPDTAITPLQALKARVEARTRTAVLLSLDSDRICVATAVVAVAAAGEMIHGFGDLFFKVLTK